MSKDDMKRFNVWMPAALYDWIQAEAEELGVPMSAFLIMTLQEVRKQQQVMNQGIPSLQRLVEAFKQMEPQLTLLAGGGAGQRDNG